jgi:hypothetical protein
MTLVLNGIIEIVCGGRDRVFYRCQLDKILWINTNTSKIFKLEAN